MKYHKKFLLGIEILNYLKYVCFGIGKRYFFEFNLIDNYGDVHLFVESEPKYTPSRVIQITKSTTARKICEVHSELEKNCCIASSGVKEVSLE